MRREADVIVVGGGGAGLAAAVEAAALGRSVILFEKNPELGGSTAWSVGSISVNRSPQQRRQGIRDTADEHFEDLETLAGAYAGRDNPVLRRLLVDNITETFEWLQAMGLVFLGPMPEPPHRHARMHNVLPNSKAFPRRLAKRARSLGVDIRCNSAVETLELSEGRVAGVRVGKAGGEPAVVRALGGVVLAGGDYSANPELLRTFASEAAVRLLPVNPTASGAGIELGLSAGGVVVNGDIIRGPVLRFVPPPKRPFFDALPAHPLVGHLMRWGFEVLPRRLTRPLLMRFLTTALGLSPGLLGAGALLVGADGQNISSDDETAAAATARQPGSQAWVVFDQRIAERFAAWPNYVSTAPGIAYAYLDDYRRTRPDIFHRAGSSAALAAALGMPVEPFCQTVAQAGDPFSDAETGMPLGQPPFYALGPVKAYVVFTDGGLAVNERLQVLDHGANIIPGLYAAGSNGQGGLILEGHGHHLGWAFVSGRIAGRNAAHAQAMQGHNMSAHPA